MFSNYRTQSGIKIFILGTRALSQEGFTKVYFFIRFSLCFLCALLPFAVNFWMFNDTIYDK